MTKSVLLDSPIHPDALALLEGGAKAVLLYEATVEELRHTLPDVHAAIVSTRFPIRAREIELGHQLEVIGRPGAGVDSVDLAAADLAGIPVVYAPQAPTESVAEHVLCFMLMLAKQIRKADQAIREGDFAFRTRATGIEILGKTLGIIGGGHIGSRVARICGGAFDMRVLLYDPYLTPAQARACGGELCSTLDHVMRESDFISLHTPLNPETRQLVGKREIELMKPTAFLINTSRGPVVDESALIAALGEGRIAGAGLDVFETEPLDSNSALLRMDNVVLTPHLSSFTDEGRYRMGITVVEQVLQVFRGQRPQFLANSDVWERRRAVSG